MDSKTYIEEIVKAVDVPLSLRRIFTASSVVLLIGIAFLILLQSPFSPGSLNYPNNDSSLFAYVGSQILDGIMPYRDIFDFHPPLIFLINALGLLFAGPLGIWFLEFLCLVSTLVILFFTLNHSVGPIPAFLSCLVVAALIALSLKGGNCIEEYVLLLQVIALASFLDAFKRQVLTLASVYFIGISAALTFLLKPLLVFFWLPFVLVIIFLVFKRDGFVMGITRALSLLFATTIAFILLLPWFYVNNALVSYLDQVFVFAKELAAFVTSQQRIATLQSLVLSWPFILTVFISLAAIVRSLITSKLAKRTGDKSDTSTLSTSPDSEDSSVAFGGDTLIVLGTNLFATLTIYGAMAFDGKVGEQFLLPSFICLAIPLAYAFHRFVQSFADKAYLQAAFGSVFLLVLVFVVVVPSFEAALAQAQAYQGDSLALEQRKELVDILEQNQASEDPIIVFGDDCWIYTAADSYSATRYAYQPFGEGFRPDLTEDFYRQVTVAQARLLVDRTDSGLARQYPGIDDYEQIATTDSYTVYLRKE